MPTYLDINVARARSNVPTAITDAMLNTVANGVEYGIELYLGYSPVTASEILYLDGNGTARLPLQGAFPTTAVAAVWENYQGWYQSTNFTSSTLLVEGTDYAVEVQYGTNQVTALIRLNSVWPVIYARPVDRLASLLDTCRGSVRVTATAGLTSAQMGLVQNAGYMEIAAQVASFLTGLGAQTSSSMDGYSLAISQWNLPGQARRRFMSPIAEMALAPLKRTVMAK